MKNAQKTPKKYLSNVDSKRLSWIPLCFFLFNFLSCNFEELTQLGNEMQKLADTTYELYNNHDYSCQKKWLTENFIVKNFIAFESDELRKEKLLLLELAPKIKDCNQQKRIASDIRDIVVSLGHVGALLNAVGSANDFSYQDAKLDLSNDLVLRLSADHSHKITAIKRSTKILLENILKNSPLKISSLKSKRISRRLISKNAESLEHNLDDIRTQLVFHFKKEIEKLEKKNKSLWKKIEQLYYDRSKTLELINGKDLYTENQELIENQLEKIVLFDAGTDNLITHLQDLRSQIRGKHLF